MIINVYGCYITIAANGSNDNKITFFNFANFHDKLVHF